MLVTKLMIEQKSYLLCLMESHFRTKNKLLLLSEKCIFYYYELTVRNFCCSTFYNPKMIVLIYFLLTNVYI